MPHSEIKSAPPLYGWTIAIAAGAVATAVSFLLIGIEGNGSVLIGAVIALVVGVIFTIAETPPSKRPVKPTQQVTAKTAATPSEPVAPAAATTPTAAPAAAATPTSTATPASASDDVGVQPQALDAPVGEADDLKQISGVGPVLEGKLNDLGIYHFWQIAGWSPAEITWIENFLNSKGRIARDEWLEQASKLAASSPSKPPA